MRGKVLFSFVLFILFLLWILHSPAREYDPPRSDRKGNAQNGNERYEGIMRSKAASGRLILKSAIAEYDKKEQKDPKFFRIGFYIHSLAKSKDIDIFLEDGRRDSNYYMMPINMRWSEGFQEFRWENDFARKKGVALSDLYVRAKVDEKRSTKTIFPVAIYHSEGPVRVRSYVFIFVANRPVNLMCTIYDGNAKEVDSDEFIERPRGDEIEFEWKCEEENAASGLYRLLVEYDLLGGEVLSSSETYVFYHAGTWSKGRE